MLTYTYDCPVLNRRYEVRIDYRTRWENDETNITDGLVRVVDTTSHTEVYCSEDAIFFFDPDYEEEVIQYLMFDARVLVPNPEILREQVFEAKRELQDNRRHYDEAMANIKPLIDAYRTHGARVKADATDEAIVALILSAVNGAMTTRWALEHAQRTVTTWEQREAELRSEPST
jgi:hypothetical protein